MVSLKWGDVLSTLLPGSVALFAIAPYFPLLHEQMLHLNDIEIGSGLALLIAAALVGGLLEAVTRITWERWWLVKRCPPMDVLPNLTAENMDLYERGIQGNYKYATFYANFAWATLLLCVSRLDQGVSVLSVGTLLLAVSIGVLLRASHVQWTYYVNYQTNVFGGKNRDAEERSATGNEGQVHAGSTAGQSG